MPRWAIVTVTLVLFTVTAKAEEQPLYRCSALSYANLAQDGTLLMSKDEAPILNALKSILVDTATGTIRFASSTRHWQVIQRGSAANDFVAAAGPSAARSVTDFIRVRKHAGEDTAVFFLVGLTTMSTGTCQTVQ